MKKKIFLILFAGILLLGADEAIARGGRGHHHGYRRSHHGGRIVIVRPRIRPYRFYYPRRRIVISPTVVIGGTTTTVVKEPTVVREETVIIWVNNDNGSRTEVRLKRALDGGYIGPGGEYYTTLPTEEQLKVLYGIVSAAPYQGSVIVWITNSNGSRTSVTLVPSGRGYVGPKGEYYPTMPTEEQLKAAYGN